MVRFLYTHNPFYLLSACFVLYGLKLWTAEQPVDVTTAWRLWSALSVYTLIMAITAWLVVRVGKVWEDGRMLALLVILLLVAISSCFDEYFHDQFATAQLVMLASAAFGVVVCEALLIGLRVNFPILYRLPFHLLLLLFFVAPVLLKHPQLQVESISEGMRVLFYPCVAALLSLTLLPAIRSGSNVFASNGTPWKWPLYPWSIFVFLLLGTAIRTYVMTLSFVSDQGFQSVFAPYFMVPLVLAIGLLIFEVGVTEKSEGCRATSIAAPIIAMLLAVMGSRTTTQWRLVDELITQAGSPIWITLILSTIFFTWLASRRNETALFGMLSGLLTLGVTPQNLIAAEQIRFVSIWPIVGASMICLCVGLLRKSSGWVFLACTLAVVLLPIVVYGRWNQTPLTFYGGIIHGWIGCLVLIAICFRDVFASWLREFGLPISVAIVALASPIAIVIAHIHPGAVLCYQAILTCAAIAVAYALRMRWWLNSALICIAVVLLTGLVCFVQIVRTWRIIKPMLVIAAGVVFFVIGAMISVWKGGLANRWSPKIAKLRERFRQPKTLATENIEPTLDT